MNDKFVIDHHSSHPQYYLIIKSRHYDYIFLGSGCASLSLLVRMADSGNFGDKKILLLDKEAKNKNDRTWCFWEKEKGYFEEIVYKSWSQLDFKSDTEQIDLDISPYKYKMIRGIDFYEYALKKISSLQIETVYGAIAFSENKKDIIFNGEKLETGSATVFNSVYRHHPDQTHFQLLQHFKGWIIETEGDSFDPSKATLMDFSIDQKHGTSFVYVLPVSPNRALVEYTLFTSDLLTDQEYQSGLDDYIKHHLKLENFTVIEEEFGIIPMTNAPFNFYEHGRYNIGTAGGSTKPSTGYTFRFIQKNSDKILQDLIKHGKPASSYSENARFRFYDSTFLHILSKNKLPGRDVFTRLFKKNKASVIFRFLDNESSGGEELKIISSLPTWPFLKAGVTELLK